MIGLTVFAGLPSAVVVVACLAAAELGSGRLSVLQAAIQISMESDPMMENGIMNRTKALVGWG